MILLVGTGIFFTLRLNFIQIRKFGHGLKQLTGGFSMNGKAADHNGMSSFQALLQLLLQHKLGQGILQGQQQQL